MYSTKTIAKLKEMADNNATFMELVEYVHDREGIPPYDRRIILLTFREAFNLGIVDVSQAVFACHIFGGSYSISEIELRFKEKLANTYFPFR